MITLFYFNRAVSIFLQWIFMTVKLVVVDVDHKIIGNVENWIFITVYNWKYKSFMKLCHISFSFSSTVCITGVHDATVCLY